MGRRFSVAIVTGLLLAIPSVALAAPVMRTLDLRLAVDANQEWRRDPAWSKGSTQQRYVIATQLRSDGRLYIDNLLDPDLDRRMRIKTDWYLYQGLLEIKADNGGTLPAKRVAEPVLSAGVLMESGGMVSPLLGSMSPQRMTALQAIRERSTEELEVFMRQYDRQGGR